MGLIDEVVDKKSLEDLQLTPKTPKEKTEPKLTENKINKAIKALKNPSAYNGYAVMASKLELSKAQLMKIKKKVAAKIADLVQGEVEPGPAPKTPINKSKLTKKSATVIYNLFIAGVDERTLFVKHGFDMSVVKGFKAELKRIKAELYKALPKDISSTYLSPSKIRVDFGIPSYVEEKIKKVVMEK